MPNLFIGLFWLVLGLGLIFIPGFQAWTIRGTQDVNPPNGLSIGWLAIVLAAYNFLRWGLWYRAQRPRREPDSGPPPQPREYHPEFDFTKDQPGQKQP